MAEAENEELRRHLVDAHEQLAERDQEFRYWREELQSRDEKIAALERDRAELRTHAEARTAELEGIIDSMQATRIWRIGLRYRGIRDGVNRVLRSGKQPARRS